MAEIIEELAFRRFGCFERRLRLDDEPLIDNHVDSLHRQNVSLVCHMSTHLPPNSMAAHEELSLEGHHVNVLEKAEAKSVVTS